MAARRGYRHGRPHLAGRNPGQPRSAAGSQATARSLASAASPHTWAQLQEFIVFEDSFRDAWKKRYTDLTPASDYNIDYALLASSRMEPLLRDIRNSWMAPGCTAKASRASATSASRRSPSATDALGTCDNHSIYKNGAKEIADKHGKSLTFMAKFNEREGQLGALHLSVVGEEGEPVMADKDRPYGFSKLMEHWIAGAARDHARVEPFLAPNINSYKRFVEGSFYAGRCSAWGSTIAPALCALSVTVARFESRTGYPAAM